MTGDLPLPRKGAQSRLRERFSGIRIRVLGIALIPSATLFIAGVIFSSSLISSGLSARDFSNITGHALGDLTQIQASVENERLLSLRALGGDAQALAGLRAQWNATDAAFGAVSPAMNAFDRPWL